jgi:phosphoserine phosphatase
MIIACDLEGTLTSGESWKGVGRYLQQGQQRWAYRAFFVARLPKALAAKAGVSDSQAFRDRWMTDLSQFFHGQPTTKLREAAEWVVAEELWPKRRRVVLAELVEHQKQGHQVILASATYQPILEVFAARIGANAVGTPLEIADGQATGRILGKVSSGELKASRLMEFAGVQKLHAAYGDTLADLPLLIRSENPVAVFPDLGLRREALARGWRILS